MTNYKRSRAGPLSTVRLITTTITKPVTLRFTSEVGSGVLPDRECIRKVVSIDFNNIGIHNLLFL